MARLITDRVFELRDWQAEAFRKSVEYIKSGRKDFLCVATPGAGKTKFALRLAHFILKEKIAERIVVVTPTEGLKNQWAEAAVVFSGIDLDPDFSNSYGIETTDYHGIAVTYALLGQDKKGIHSQNSFEKRTMVILDEVHHAGDNLSWGDAVRNSFQEAVFRLCISGTAFRSDDNEIPYISYENGVSRADYNYSYERAIKDNVCRPVYFQIFDGKMKWKVAQEEFEHDFRDVLSPDQVSKRLKTALDVKGNFIKDIIKAADLKLSEIRHSHRDAAGLVFCITQQHAKEVAKVVEEITGIKPPIVVSEDPQGNKKIEEFRNSNDRWIVSVKMVSEGVDIPRLRVGAYLTNIKAELFFRQAVGRFVRVLSHLQWQDAFVFIPQDRDIVKLAETINEERDHALEECESKSAGDSSSDSFFPDYIPALQGKFIPLGSEATNSKMIAVAMDISSGMKHSIIATQQNPVYQQKAELRDRLNSLAKKYALKIGRTNPAIKPDFKMAHKIWIDQGGKNMDLETIEELKTREKFYINLLRN